MQQRREAEMTKQEVELRLYAAGGRKGKEDPLVRRMLAGYSKPVSDEEIYRIMDKALGDKSVVDALYEIR